MAFWIRKLKPVAKAYPLKIVGGLAAGASPPLENEDTEVNEKLSILVALRNLHAYIADDLVGLPHKKSTAEYLALYERVNVEFFNETGAEFDYLGSRVKSLVYDMRFRTFGPHHLTHILVTLVRELAKG